MQSGLTTACKTTLLILMGSYSAVLDYSKNVDSLTGEDDDVSVVSCPPGGFLSL